MEASPAYTPMPWTLSEIKRAIPARLHVRQTWRGVLYALRDLAMGAGAWWLASFIDRYTMHSTVVTHIGEPLSTVLRWACWAVYWWYQGLIFSGIWVMGHECGHGAVSENKLLCDVIGYIMHTIVLTPYFSWRVTHHRHHTHTGSMERDDAYRPLTKTQYHHHASLELEELLGDTPIYTLVMMFLHQLLGYPIHMLHHVLGSHRFPKWLPKYDETFARNQTKAVILSNIGILAMGGLIWQGCRTYGTGTVMRYYGVPWVLVSHWFAMVTYLQHTDPIVPRYSNGAWTFARGMASTIDRDFLGATGKFFLHGIAHYHVVHHYFPKIPFYNIEEATEYLKDFIGPAHYHYDAKPAFKAMWDNLTRCRFVDDSGDVLFYRDAQGTVVSSVKGGVTASQY